MLRKALLFCLGLYVLAGTAAELNESSAELQYSQWKSLTTEQQLPVLADLIAYYSKNNTARALELADVALHQLQTYSAPELQARIMNDKAYAMFMNGQWLEAVEILTLSQRLAQQHHWPLIAGRASTILGYIYQGAGLTEQALLQHQRALSAYEHSNETQVYASVLKNIADLLIDQNQFAQSEGYVRQLKKLLDDNPQLSKGNYFELLGDLASKQEDIEQTLKHYSDSLREHEQHNNRIGQHVMCAAVAHSLNELGRADEAMEFIERGLALQKETGSDARTVNLLRERATALIVKGELKQAKSLLLDLAERARAINDNGNLAGIYVDLARVTQQLGDWQSAFSFQRDSHELGDRMLNENISRRTVLLDAAFQSERKNKEIDLLRSENRVQQLELDKQRQRTIVVAALSLTTLVLLILIVLRWQHKKELARELAVNHKLMELDQLKDQMLANTSHELRTPLNGIVGLSEILLHSNLDGHIRHHVELIAESGRRLTDVVNELLDFARLKQNKIVLNPQPVSVGDAVSKAIHLTSPAANEKQLTVHNRIAQNLPMAKADHDRLQQVLLNLINNAIKFTSHGHVEVDAVVKSRQIEISIKDTGIGIPQEMQGKIFEAFQQVDGSTVRRHQGTGLGLSITKQLVELWGGEIGVESHLNRGSRFWFTLPLSA